MISDDKLDFWIKNKRNVLMIGKHGTGKSTVIRDACERNNIKWKYFSTPTMDPFTDFLGIPKEKVTENGSYLEFVRPKEFINNDFQLLFFDEFNRSMPKLQNSVMELLQFHSINGNKFGNLDMIWAAINPEETDDEDIVYSVEKLDPAIKDRFHIIVETDDKPDRKFFMGKYGNNGKIIVDWWNSLPKEINKHISPRRLDYTLEEFNIAGDIADVLPKNVNLIQLLDQLNNGSFSDRLEKIYSDKNKPEAISVLKNENFYNGVIKIILARDEYMQFFASCFSAEKFNNLIITDAKFRKKILKDGVLVNENIERLKSIVASNSAAQKIIDEIKREIKGSFDNLEFFLDEHLKSKTDTLNNTQERASAIKQLLTFNLKKISKIDLLEQIFVIASTIYFRTNTDWTDTKKVLNLVKSVYVNDFGHTKETLRNAALNHSYLKQWLGTPERIEKMNKKWDRAGT